MSNCVFPFRHPERPRDTCRLPTPPGGALCVWHDPSARSATFDAKTALTSILGTPDHWLEGAQLAELSLCGLSAPNAKMPLADLEACDISAGHFPQALLEEAVLRSVNGFGVDLTGACLRGAILVSANLSNAVLSEVNAVATDFEGATLNGASLGGMRFDPDTTLADIDWGHPAEFTRCHWDRAASVFQRISRHFGSCGNVTESNDFYFREMTARHLSAIGAKCAPTGGGLYGLRCFLPGSPSKWSQCLIWSGHRWGWGYSVRPWRTFACMACTILLFGLIFSLIGIHTPGDHTTRSPLVGLGLSVVTFSTLGYGNYYPQGVLGALLAGAEALAGALLAGGFLVALANAYLRRS